jgi:hypothetical protein
MTAAPFKSEFQASPNDLNPIKYPLKITHPNPKEAKDLRANDRGNKSDTNDVLLILSRSASPEKINACA